MVTEVESDTDAEPLVPPPPQEIQFNDKSLPALPLLAVLDPAAAKHLPSIHFTRCCCALTSVTSIDPTITAVQRYTAEVNNVSFAEAVKRK